MLTPPPPEPTTPAPAFPSEDLHKLRDDTIAMQTLLNSDGWRIHVLARIGRPALEHAAAQNFDRKGITADELLACKHAHRALDRLRADLENQLQVNLNILRKHNLLPGAETILPATSPADSPVVFPEEDSFDPFGALPNCDSPSV